ncbi:MAG: hypothetical protein KKF79_10890 [Gammaproteobacteria bacterium]|nr:hypothetical protein [Gammaproteobacteria bacterium]
MKLFYSLPLLMFAGYALAADITMMTKEHYRSVYDRMIKQTYQDDSFIASIGGFACPSLLIYSTVQQRFVSDEVKFQLLELDKANSRIPLTIVPALIANRPKNHPYFSQLAPEKLLEFLPEADLKNDYITFFCSKTKEAALSTEGLLAKFIKEGSEDHNHIHTLDLIEHLDLIVQKQNHWQVLMYRNED